AASRNARPALARGLGARRAALLGRDLAALVPDVRRLALCLAAAHFDPAEALRPGWPLHRRLMELHARAPRGGGEPRIIALGANAGGEVPPTLADEPALRVGSMRVLPFLMIGVPKVAVYGTDAL